MPRTHQRRNSATRSARGAIERRMGSATHSTPVREAVRSSSSPGPETRTTRNPERRSTRKRAPRIRHSSCVVTPRRMVDCSLKPGESRKERDLESAIECLRRVKIPASEGWSADSGEILGPVYQFETPRLEQSNAQSVTVNTHLGLSFRREWFSSRESQALETDGAANENPPASFASGRRRSRTRNRSAGAWFVAREVR